MDIHNLIFLLIKNLVYFILLIILVGLIVVIAKLMHLQLMAVAVDSFSFVCVALVWIGYLNTKDSNDHKLKNGLIFHLILGTLLGVLASFYDNRSLWKQVLDTLLFISILEIGSLIYYVKKHKKNVSAI